MNGRILRNYADISCIDVHELRTSLCHILHTGKIREMGGHEELLALKGIYYRLYQLQFAGEAA